MDFSTSSWLFTLFLFVLGLGILVKGSDWFVEGAAGIARKLGVSEMVIGLTLVSIGTSLPELASSLYASSQGEPAFVVGNVIGSCSTNILLILGVGAAFGGRMSFSRELLKRDTFLMDGVFLLMPAMVFFTAPVDKGFHGISRLEGGVLLAMAIGYCCVLFCKRTPAPEEVTAGNAPASGSVGKFLLFFAAGAIMITLGSKLLVDNVVRLATEWGVSTMLISATVVAFGTSVPELAVTISGVRKKKFDLALGNIIGSCTFNILLIIGGCALLTPIPVTAAGDGMANMFLMCVTGLLLTIMMMINRRDLPRAAGVILLVGYLFFCVYNCRELLPF